MNEREQKRMYHSSNTDMHGGVYPWVYYLLGVDKKQYAVYHGCQIADAMYQSVGCGPQANPTTSVYFYPAEYNTYGSGSSVEMTYRFDGTDWVKHFKVTDHLGNIRSVLKDDSVGGYTITGQYDYKPFGGIFNSYINADNHRQSFIGKPTSGVEKDNESSLVDNPTGWLGVRKSRQVGMQAYDDFAGRFFQIDPLWEKYYDLTPYNYSANNPLILVDKNGMWFKGVHEQLTREAISEFGLNVREIHIDRIVEGNRAVDNNQGWRDQYQHWMLSPKLIEHYEALGYDPYEAAYEEAMTFINDNLKDFINNDNLEALGRALHTIQDKFCPVHEGFQVFTTREENFLSWAIGGLWHMRGDFGEWAQPDAYKAAKEATKEALKIAIRKRNDRLREQRSEARSDSYGIKSANNVNYIR